MTHTTLLRDPALPGVGYHVTRFDDGSDEPVALGTAVSLPGEKGWRATRTSGQVRQGVRSLMDAVDWLDNDRRRHQYREQLSQLAAGARALHPDATAQAEVDRICETAEIGALADVVKTYAAMVASANGGL